MTLGPLVIGYGNPLRADDGAGRLAAAQVARFWPDVTVYQQHQLLPELADPISQADIVIFIDVALGEKPGQVACQLVTPATSSPSFTHQCDPAGLLALAHDLYGRFPPAYLLTVTGTDFGFRESPSPAVVAAIPRLVTQVQPLLGSY